MLDLKRLPEVQSGDLQVGSCALSCTLLGTASTPQEAWALLPADGRGVVVLADRVVSFEASGRQGLIVEAEVVGPDGTTLLRMDGLSWRAWKWVEAAGDSHRYLERRFRSSQPVAGGDPPHLVYRQYWTLLKDAGAADVAVWQPVGSCLVGFEEEGR